MGVRGTDCAYCVLYSYRSGHPDSSLPIPTAPAIPTAPVSIPTAPAIPTAPSIPTAPVSIPTAALDSDRPGHPDRAIRFVQGSDDTGLTVSVEDDVELPGT